MTKENETIKNKQKRVKFCPQCGSMNIFWVHGLPHLWSIWNAENAVTEEHYIRY